MASDRAVLAAIHELMDGKEWSADTLQSIAEVLTGAGLRIREPDVGGGDAPRYECPTCGSFDVELCFPVWVKANDIDDRDAWQLDVEASPEKDSDKGFCPSCSTNVLVRKAKEATHGP